MSNHIVKRGVLVVVLSIIISLSMTYMAAAFGISVQYLENNTLNMNAGDDYSYKLTLQNGENTEYDVSIIYNSTDNVASFPEGKIIVPAKSYNTSGYFHISIPKDAKVGKEYLLEYTTRPVRSGAVDSGSTSADIHRSLKIKVADNPKGIAKDSNKADDASRKKRNEMYMRILKESGKYLLMIIVIIILCVIGFRVWNISRKMSSRITKARPANHTISDAESMDEVKAILQNISDEEFSIPEIRNIFRNKISSLGYLGKIRFNDAITRKELIDSISTDSKP